jgi:hypothetical protein
MDEDKRTIQVRDVMNGEELTIEYFPDSGTYRINGINVVRAEALEDRTDASVFQDRATNRLYTVLHSDLHRLRAPRNH